MTRLFKEMLVIFLGFVAGIYLIFPTLGIFELIPDAIPLIGSLDEAGATVLLLNVMNYYGIDVTRFFNRPTPKKRRPKQLDDGQGGE